MWTKVNWKWPNNDKLKVHTVYGSACTNLVLVAVSDWLTEGARSEERLYFFWLLKTKFGFHQMETSKALKHHSAQELCSSIINQLWLQPCLNLRAVWEKNSQNCSSHYDHNVPHLPSDLLFRWLTCVPASILISSRVNREPRKAEFPPGSRQAGSAAECGVDSQRAFSTGLLLPSPARPRPGTHWTMTVSFL